jgi:hypothetical protein
VDTTVGQGIDSADIGAQYDAACKRVLSEKIILAYIMKECLEEFSDASLDDIANKYIEGTPEIGETLVLADGAPRIKGGANEGATIHEGTVIFDIRFRVIAPTLDGYIQLILNVEAQQDYYPGYPLIKRGIYYCSRLISAQYGVDFPPEQYSKVKKVYSIWICMNLPKHRENTINRYRMTEEHLVGEVKEKLENYDLLTTLMICLGDSDRTQGLLRLLDVLLAANIQPETKKNVLEDEFSIPISQSFEQEVSGMCNLSKGVLERGRKEGIEQGIKEGKKEGIKENRLQSIKDLMETISLSFEQAVEALKIPVNERAEYARLLGK